MKSPFHTRLSLFQKTGFRQTTIKTIGTTMLLSLFVRMVGLAKESTIANFLGVSAITDAYVLSIILFTFCIAPVAGSISPILTTQLRELLAQNEQRPASIFITKSIFSCFAVMAIVTLALAFISSGPLNLGLFSGIDDNHLNMLVSWIIPIGILGSISVVAQAVFTAEERFITQTATPLCISSLVILSCFIYPKTVTGVAVFVGTFAGYMFETVVSLFLIRKYLVPSVTGVVRQTNKAFKKLLAQWPALAAASLLANACVIVDQVMASLVGVGAVATITFGNRIPLGIISIIAVLWTVVFPKFIDDAQSGRFETLRRSLLAINLMVIFGGFVGCGILSILSEPMISLLYERGAFTATDTDIVSRIQVFYFMHIPFYVSFLISLRVINVFERSGLYLFSSFSVLACNVMMNLIFIEVLGIVGVALATTITYVFASLFWYRQAQKLIQAAAANSG